MRWEKKEFRIAGEGSEGCYFDILFVMVTDADAVVAIVVGMGSGNWCNWCKWLWSWCVFDVPSLVRVGVGLYQKTPI